MCVLYNMIFRLQPAPSIPPPPRPSLYLIPSYRRCRRLAILTAVYRWWLTEKETADGRSDFRKSNSTPTDRIYLVLYLWYNIWHSEETHTHTHKHTRTSVYLYSGEEWCRVCAIWILIIKISRGFDRFVVAQKWSGSHHKYFRYSLNVDDVSRAHASVL